MQIREAFHEAAFRVKCFWGWVCWIEQLPANEGMDYSRLPFAAVSPLISRTAFAAVLSLSYRAKPWRTSNRLIQRDSTCGQRVRFPASRMCGGAVP